MSLTRTLNLIPLCLCVLLSSAAAAAEPAQGAATAWLGAFGDGDRQTPGGVWVGLALLAVALILRQIGKKKRPLPY